ncbi:MAG: AI-2E family transporter [Candidatus Pacebacteria bacterium]|jgi:predicted PurR-regulated permease PerM|nr:AI-2E family transporter [Candidatus Paceibacterota bacterium]
MKSQEKDTVISITSGTIVKGLAILLGAWALWILRDLLMIIVTSVILASSIEPGIKFLSKFRIHRIPAVLLTYLAFAGLLIALIFAFVPPIVNEAAEITQKLPSMMQALDKNVLGDKGILVSVFEKGSSGADIADLFGKISGSNTGEQDAFGAVRALFGGVFSFVLIVVLSFYFAMQERGIENFLRIIIPFGNEEYAINLWERSRAKIGKWMQGQLLLGVLIFVLVYLGLTIFGVPYAMSLALLAGLLEIIPVFGPILSAIPGVILAFTVGGPTLAVIVAAFYLLVQQFESHLIYPLVVRKVVGVPPILVILALIVGIELGGVLGVLISVPVAAALMELVEDIERRKGMLA